MTSGIDRRRFTVGSAGLIASAVSGSRRTGTASGS